MAVKVTKGQICSGTISKFNVTRSASCVENFILVSKRAHKAPFFGPMPLYYSAYKNNV